jgi:ATPase subunit of ABC transporter with duplicated ATPase domains
VLLLLRLQAAGWNVLVLDQPTNHLNLPVVERLESALESYAERLLLVIHDRRMPDAVRTTRCWMLVNG